jgi:hypothetical protein
MMLHNHLAECSLIARPQSPEKIRLALTIVAHAVSVGA